MPEKDLDKLSRLVDEAMAAAIQMEEKTTAYILSIASLEVSLRIEAANGAKPDETE
jgi:hypothetical protein